jgi:hypothetical protein
MREGSAGTSIRGPEILEGISEGPTYQVPSCCITLLCLSLLCIKYMSSGHSAAQEIKHL